MTLMLKSKNKQMKKIFFLLMTLGWLSALNAQWIDQNSGTAASLSDVFCITADTVIVVGNPGIILRTTNGGLQWNSISSPSTEWLYHVEFTDSHTGYIVGDNNTLLKSTDAGQTWQSLNTGISMNYYALHCLSADTLYVAGSQGTMLKTVDGGTSWTSENTGTVYGIVDMQMINDTLGYAISCMPNMWQSNIIKKNNSGNQWQEIVQGNSYLSALHMLNGMEGFFLNYQGSIGITQNGGNDFFGVVPQESYCANDIYASDISHIWVVGALCYVGYPSNDNGLIAKYTLNNDPNTGYVDHVEIAYTNNSDLFINAITFYNNTGFAVGTNGLILKNTTGINTIDNLGISNKSFEIFSVSPNPAQNQVSINLKDIPNQQTIQYRIIDLQGKELMPFSVLQTGKSIDISNLTNGIYLIQVQTNGQVYTQKLLIQK